MHLINGSSKLKLECRVYEIRNNSRSLLDDPRTIMLENIMPYIRE